MDGWWEVYGGFVVIGLTVMLIGAFVTFRLLRWRKEQPETWYRGVGILYQEGSAEPWEGVKSLIDSILDQQKFEADSKFRKLKKWSDFWIEVIPYNKPLINHAHPTGYVWRQGQPRAGFPCSPPENDEEVEIKAIVNGSHRIARALPVTKKHYVLMVRQLRHGVSRVDMVMLRGEGRTKSAGWSAAHHEHAEHWISYLLGRGWNVYHKDNELKDLKSRMRNRYNDRHVEQMS
jgi:hypothetical protein